MRTKTSCHLSQDGIDATLFFMKENNKTSRLYIRLTNGENNKLRELAKDYPNLSSFVLDACWHFKSKRHIRVLDFFEEKFELVSKLRNDLNRIGANFNQLVQYTNNCMILGLYQDNTVDEIIRLQSEIISCLSDYKLEIRQMEKDLKQAFKLV